MLKSNLLVFLFFLRFFNACDDSRVYEKNFDFKDNDWYMDTIPTFEFKISDTKTKYNVLLNVRNGLSYPYTNIYIKYNLLDSTSKSLESKLVRFELFDEKTGKPHGSGLGDIFDNQKYLFQSYDFPYKGKYTIKLQQYMRKNPLPFVMATGIRVEKDED